MLELVLIIALNQPQRRIEINPSQFMTDCINRNVVDIANQYQRDAGMKLCTCSLKVFEENARNQEFIEAIREDREGAIAQVESFCKGSITQP